MKETDLMLLDGSHDDSANTVRWCFFFFSFYRFFGQVCLFPSVNFEQSCWGQTCCCLVAPMMTALVIGTHNSFYWLLALISAAVWLHQEPQIHRHSYKQLMRCKVGGHPYLVLTKSSHDDDGADNQKWFSLSKFWWLSFCRTEFKLTGIHSWVVVVASMMTVLMAR